jgi:hypothetical protein
LYRLRGITVKRRFRGSAGFTPLHSLDFNLE